MFSFIIILILFGISQSVVQYLIGILIQGNSYNQEAFLKRYHLIFLPGIFIHEASHLVMAAVLGVPTGRFILFPQQMKAKKDGSVTMGALEVAQTDFIRGSLIGAAPLITGVGVMLFFAKFYQLDFIGEQLLAGNLPLFFAQIGELFQQPLLLVIVPLLLIINHTMLPSKTDQRDWFSLAIFVLLIVGGVFLTSSLNLLNPVWDYLQQGIQYLGTALGISVVINLFFIPILWGIKKIFFG